MAGVRIFNLKRRLIIFIFFKVKKLIIQLTSVNDGKTSGRLPAERLRRGRGSGHLHVRGPRHNRLRPLLGPLVVGKSPGNSGVNPIMIIL